MCLECDRMIGGNSSVDSLFDEFRGWLHYLKVGPDWRWVNGEWGGKEYSCPMLFLSCSSSWILKVEQLSTTMPFHYAASALDPSNHRLNLLKTMSQTKPLILWVASVGYFVPAMGKWVIQRDEDQLDTWSDKACWKSWSFDAIVPGIHTLFPQLFPKYPAASSHILDNLRLFSAFRN